MKFKLLLLSLISSISFAAHVPNRSIYMTDVTTVNGTSVIKIPTAATNASRVMVTNSDNEITSSTVNSADLPFISGASSLTAGSVLFSNGTTIAQDNAHFFWDDANNRLGLGTTTPNQQLELTGNLRIPVTTGSSAGIIYAGTDYFLHSFGTNNLFLGINAGNLTLSTASGNTGIGANAMFALTTGTENMAFGSGAMGGVSTGSANVAIGAQAMGAPIPVTGRENIAIGRGSMYGAGDFRFNTAIGYNAMAGTNGENNVAIGDSSMFNMGGALSSNAMNVGIGNYTLYSLEGSSANTAVGDAVLIYNSTGQNNTGIGWRAGFTDVSANATTTGSNNTFIGYAAGFATTTQHDNSVAIGYLAKVDANNALILGGTGANVVNVAIGTTIPGATLHAIASSAATIGALVVGASSQTANLQEWRNSSATVLHAIAPSGHVISGGSAPAVSACGTSPSISGNDTTGTVTIGTGGIVTSCTVTFATAYSAAPHCFLNDRTEIIAVSASTSTTVLTISKTLAFAASSVIDYYCIQ